MNKKNLLIIIIAIVILILFILLFFFKFKKNDSNVSEYTPQEEFSDDEIRKTIICLYFKNKETNTLIAQAKCIDAKELYRNPYMYLVNLLISGPESEKLESPIPNGTKVNACYLEGSTVYVDFSKEFIENAPDGIDEENIIIYSIVNTLTELNEVSSVKILVDGEENSKFNDGAINFSNIFERND